MGKNKKHEVTPELMHRAMALCPFSTNIEIVDGMIQLYKILEEKGDLFSLKDAAEIKIKH